MVTTGSTVDVGAFHRAGDGGRGSEGQYDSEDQFFHVLVTPE